MRLGKSSTVEHFLAELQLIRDTDSNPGERFLALSQFFYKLIRYLPREEKMVFKNFYAKFNYVLRTLPLQKDERANLEAFRWFVRIGNAGKEADQPIVRQATALLEMLLQRMAGQTERPKNYQPHFFTKKHPQRNTAALRSIRLLCQSFSELQEQGPEPYFIIKGFDLDNLETEIELLVKRHQYVDFTYLRPLLLPNAVLVIHNIVSTGQPDQYSTSFDSLPVLEPDFLVDASAIGECFTHAGSNAGLFFLSRLVEDLPGSPALKGSMVGYFLDELICQQTPNIDTLFKTAQKNNALKAAQLGRAEMNSIRNSINTEHLPNIRLLVQRESKKELWIEPTYFSSVYGLQGRLDLLAYDEKQQARDIIELKSGSPTNPVPGQPWLNHLMQVVCYDLLLNSTYGENRLGFNAIFYSRCTVAPYRQITSIHGERARALRIRNYIVSRIYKLANRDFAMLLSFKNTGIPYLPTFQQPRLESFQDRYRPETITTQYYQELLAFTLREMINAKVGDYLTEDNEEINGFSTLWQNQVPHKEKLFRIIHHLTVAEMDTESGRIRLNITLTVPHSFRKGDLIVLYPSTDNDQEYDCMRQHILKGSIESINNHFISIALNNKQTNYGFIQQHQYWAIEPDLFERNFWCTVGSLMQVLNCDDRKKRLLLGHLEPAFSNQATHGLDLLTPTQQEAINNAVNARDYYLLQGPPGTGKTTTFLVNYLRQSLPDNTDKIVVLAFTNAAVEKICNTFRDPRNGAPIPYLRLGSRYVTDEYLFADQLTDDNPDNWKKLIEKNRIFVSTVATFQNNLLLLSKFMRFKHLVVDEASQLTEAQLSGILAVFEKFVLIGDHKQLPAVVTQEEKGCLTEPGSFLEKMQITDLRISIFERLFRNAQAKGWTTAYGQLVDHYRMHHDIAGLIAHQYSKKLLAIQEKQFSSLPPYALPADSPYYPISRHRVVFIESSPGNGLKKNSSEAATVIKLVSQLLQTGQFQRKDIGIIAPFRAQIAEIRAIMPEDWQEDETFITDTVERFQGGEKKVIVYSTTISSSRQLPGIQSIASNDTDRTDRKLLVSISRAEEQFILLGNPLALEAAPAYRSIISYCRQQDACFRADEMEYPSTETAASH
ncbi:MAG: ATP-dependent helicase [Candidatus Pseudobacter hemicellulosilyticus]|uniref:ATP-dependent helicase n=1 Tax=Candidatus Pseudobacter hemicellulosilyticus TaxID=3121375 RepID=A0AAJ6BFE8_9BACT|nr:MAG: ATP-dependent helicase [Pseudobacter sp.]